MQGSCAIDHTFVCVHLRWIAIERKTFRTCTVAAVAISVRSVIASACPANKCLKGFAFVYFTDSYDAVDMNAN